MQATSGNSHNANGVSYVAIALFDPAGRYALPFALSKPAADDNYTVNLRYPESGEPATDFTPDFVFGALGWGTAGASVYRGPGHVGDLTGKLAMSAASDADRIQALGAGTVQFGTLIGQGQGDQAFWAGRVNDGISSSRLMAVTSYTGNGTSSRNISLALNGSTPALILVVPTNAAAKVYRVNTDTTGRNAASGGGAIANTITALAANQFTVGTALNANGVTYDVWAITTGFVTPY